MKARVALLLAAVVLAPLAAALRGAPGPASLRLNLGPGDEPYLSGFFPEYEIEGATALHWSRPQARVVLPLAFTGPAELALRFGPPPGGPSRVDLALASRPLGGFDCCRHRALQRRALDASTRGPTPLRADVRVSGPEVGERGLFLDWLALELARGGRVWLLGGARLRPAALVAAVALVLVVAGFSASRAALLSTPLSLLLALALLRDPWLVHRLLARLPETVFVVVLPLAAIARFALPRLDPGARRAAVSLASLAFLLRGAALNHPDFYYPDLMVHARLVAVAREAGPRLFSAPHAVLYTPRETPSATDTLVRATSGLWLRRLGGVDVGLPYSLAFHALLAPLAGSLDATVGLLKTAGALLSAAPVAVVALLAGRCGVSPWAAAGLLLAAPTALLELSLGTVPAVLGHALDALFLLWLAARAPRAGLPGVAAEGAAVVAALQLAYVSSVITASAVLALIAAAAWRREPRAALGLLASLLGGSTLAFVAYYRDFVPGALTAFRLALAGASLTAGTGSAAFLDVGGGRVDEGFLSWVFPVVAVPAAVGLVLLLRGSCSRALLFAWALGCALLGLLRGALPSLLGFLHLALFATPLVSLAAGAALQALAAGRREGRAAAVVLATVAGAHGLYLQYGAVVAQLGKAR